MLLESKLAIHDLVSFYSHVIDERQWNRVSELFTAEARYDVSDFGAGVRFGAEAIGRNQGRREVNGTTNGRKWNSWVKAFGAEIEALDSKTNAEKKQYIECLVKRIDVR